MDSSDVMDSPDMAGPNNPLPLPPLLAAILQGRVGARRFDLVLDAAIQDAVAKSPARAEEGTKE
ncbi:hypothetical protein [Dongia sp.]|uniref:hypothetical protein n=1 Tax=Dongia sp. TaxID=1977262 RepID=UPI0035AE2124